MDLECNSNPDSPALLWPMQVTLICSSRSATVFIFWSCIVSDFSSLLKPGFRSNSKICISPRHGVHLDDSAKPKYAETKPIQGQKEGIEVGEIVGTVKIGGMSW